MIDPFSDDTDYEPLKLEKPLLTITKEPYKQFGRWVFKLSDGRTVGLAALARIPGIYPRSMKTRMERNGWQHPRILEPGDLRRDPIIPTIDKNRRVRKGADLSHIPQGIYSHLSSRQRA